MLNRIKCFIASVRSLWSSCEGCRILQALLISGAVFAVGFIAFLIYSLWDFVILILAVPFFAFIDWLGKKMMALETTVKNSLDYHMANRIAELMTEILTVVHAEVGIRKPYDVYFVWVKPTHDGKEWTYHAKARQSDTVLLDDDSTREYLEIINERAVDIGAPLKVTKIHPRGKKFIYDISTMEVAKTYISPNELKEAEQSNKLDRDF